MTVFDVEQADHLLTTTRAVRKRLDFDRPVEDDVLLRMIDIAEQTPSGSNQTSRRWIIVRDAGQKQRIADLYAQVGVAALTQLAAAAKGEDERKDRVFSSGLYLAENLSRVPAIVIATIYGVHDGSGKPSLFDSVIQSAWNFCLAGRARGIGTAWTTLHLERAAEVAEVLGIPAGVTQVVLLPVAYTTTTEFRPAPRQPAAEITFVDHWGFTPSTVDPELRGHPGDGRGVSLDVDIRATPEQLWPLVTDIGLPSRFSEEAVGASWVDPGAPAGPGHEFRGENSCVDAGHPAVNDLMAEHTTDNSWTTTCRVITWDPNREFAYDVVDDGGRTATRWRFVLQPLVGGGTRVNHSMRLHSGMSGTSATILNPDVDPEEVLVGRFLKLRTDMTRTLNGLKKMAESRG